VGPAVAEATSADHGAGHCQPGNRHLGGQAPLPICGVGLVNWEQTEELIDLYRDTATEVGYVMGPEHIGYLIGCSSPIRRPKPRIWDNNFFWQNGALGKQPREWMAPPGYATVDVAGIRKLRAVF